MTAYITKANEAQSHEEGGSEGGKRRKTRAHQKEFHCSCSQKLPISLLVPNEPHLSTLPCLSRVECERDQLREGETRRGKEGRRDVKLTNDQDLPSSSSSFVSLRPPFLRRSSPRIHSQSYERRSLSYSWSSCYLYDHSLLESMGREEEGID